MFLRSSTTGELLPFLRPLKRVVHAMRASEALGRIRGPLFRLANPGKPKYRCPVCGYHGPFRDFNRRPHARCPSCRALERHRFQYLVLKDLLAGMDTRRMRMLHFAPEPFFRRFFAGRFGRYETADLDASGVDHHVDIQALPFPDESYDFVFASHVLEHIPDDKAAIAHIRRILKPAGVAVLPVPLAAPATVEYPAPNPHEMGHVRAPGPDYFERYKLHFSRVVLIDSRSLPEENQLFLHEDRSQVSPMAPLRTPMSGDRHHDIVPICYA